MSTEGGSKWGQEAFLAMDSTHLLAVPDMDTAVDSTHLLAIPDVDMERTEGPRR